MVPDREEASIHSDPRERRVTGSAVVRRVCVYVCAFM